jgi:tetratricopeptide (TPR) repeat protein
MSTRFAAGAGAALVGMLGLGALEAAERPWIEVASPRFFVVSNSGEKEARRFAWQFEQVRSVFKEIWPWARTDSGRAFVVLAVRDETTLKRLAPQYWERKGGMRPVGVFVGGADRDFVALRTDVAEPDDVGVNPFITAYEGYAHIVLNASFPGSLPRWYQHGLGELFGNTVVRPKAVHVGRLIPWHLQTIGERARLPLRELLAAERGSSHFSDSSRRQVFDAHAWMFVHYLVFGENGSNLIRFNRYSALLRNGTEHGRAFTEALGDVEALDRGLALYLSRRLYSYALFKVDVNVDRETFPTRTLSPPEVAAARASFHAARGRNDDARALAAEARQAAPDLAAAYEVEGVLLEQEGKGDEALRAFARAAELGSRSFHVHHHLALLLWTPDPDGPTAARIVTSLEKAVQLNPGSAHATAFLADIKVESAPAEAVLLARRAVELEPGSPHHRLTLARVLGRAGQREAGLREAERGLQMAREAADRKRAQELIAWLRQAPPPPVSAVEK